MRRTPKPPTRIRSVAGGKSGSSASFRAQSSALIRPEPDETFGDMVARALDISRRQSEILLESLHDGASVDEAVAAAEIDTSHLEGDLLVQIARAIGTALGRVNRS